MNRLKSMFSFVIRNAKSIAGVVALSLIGGGAVSAWGWGIGSIVFGGVIWFDLTLTSIQNGRSD